MSGSIEMRRATHSDDGAGSRRPVLVWRFAPPAQAISTAVLGGGIGKRSWAVNAEVAEAYHHPDPAQHLTDVATELRLTAGEGVGMLTAAPVLDVVSASHGGVHCATTVGLSLPTWAASVPDSDAVWQPGTINLVCFVPTGLCDAALVNAVATATEAKVQALLELGVPGTGTASDAVLVACPSDGTEPYGGPRSLWGARLARAVHEAVRAGATQYLARQE